MAAAMRNVATTVVAGPTCGEAIITVAAVTLTPIAVTTTAATDITDTFPLIIMLLAFMDGPTTLGPHR